MDQDQILKLYELFLSSSGPCTDTRKLLPGDLFFALKGPSFNGNKFAAMALENGASHAVVDEAEFAGDQCFLVSDALEALQEIANHHRKQFKIPVIAITGSNGKTTTKELVHAVLSSHYRTMSTAGNLNNHIGVPLTLLRINKETEMAVIEMGANHPIEINQLCKIAEPNFGLITNIGKAHLEGFGSIDGVQKAKGELFEFLEAVGGKVFANANDQRIVELAYHIQNAFTYGKRKFSNAWVESLGSDPMLKVRWHYREKREKEYQGMDIQTQLIGEYNLDNVSAAIALSQKFKVPRDKVAQAINNYIPSNNRSEVLELNGNTYWLDAYNANPSSMHAALNNFELLEAERKVLVLGDMNEQGDFEEEEHLKLLEKARAMNATCYFVGPIMCRYSEKGGGRYLETVDELKKILTEEPFEKATVLVKGSRSIGLEKLVKI